MAQVLLLAGPLLAPLLLGEGARWDLGEVLRSAFPDHGLRQGPCPCPSRPSPSLLPFPIFFDVMAT